MQIQYALCNAERHLEPIRAILNHAIVHTTALYEYEPRTTAQMTLWFAQKDRLGLPIIGAFDATGDLLGFATYGAFRPQAAFQSTAEHSVYVRHDRQGLGIGKALLAQLIDHAQLHGVRQLIGVIDAQNAVSIALHEQLGFIHAGTLTAVGVKFERSLDVVLYQCSL